MSPSADIFAASAEERRVENVLALKGFPFYRRLERVDGPWVSVDDRRLLMLGSSDYLGLAQHPEVREAVTAAVERYGSSCAGSPVLNGYLTLHRELEEAVASLVGCDAAVLFASGYQANLGALTSIGSRGRDLIVCDRLVHASLIDAGKLARARVGFFAHNNPASLEKALRRRRRDGAGAMVVVEGAYSVDGDLCDLEPLSRVAAEHGARVLVDEAHSVGTVGDGGGGLARALGLAPGALMVSGTFSKALASTGGFVAGPAEIVDLIRQRARALIFSASLAPACAAAALAAIRILQREPERVGALADRVRILTTELRDAGYVVWGGEGPVLTVLCGSWDDTVAFWRRLFDAGVFANAIVPPAVPPGKGRIRLSLTCHLAEAELAAAVRTFQRLAPSYRPPQ